MNEDFVEVHAVVKGRVQGVGFRFTTKKIADALGLKGSVRNTPDGDVEICVQGNPVTIDELLARLKGGVGKIESIKLENVAATVRFKDFQITY